ncbi:CBO0543 family protein [Pelosinus sp. UFO1]|uniref:CBO0543 family protein n=1 Tax=Pelosinus sp. UFO1 TaxID=484770 RepID=UPI0004D11ECE|nr:CBO0543 family protein [Pelosinus sp. UFO1]AIF53094.1 hypothetical protein UFO1_3551 [Pelosinus sp. UFO1]
MDIGSTIHQLKIDLWDLNYTQWKTQILFSPIWWSYITIIVISYAIWWKLVDKRRLTQLLLFGSLVSVGRILIDIIGSNMNLWSYNIRESPFIPSPFLHNFTISPLAFMLLLQYTSSWKSFIIWNAVITGVYSFVLNPIMISLHILTLYKWNYFYAFAVVFTMVSVCRAVLVGTLYLEKKYQGVSSDNSVKNLSCQPAMKPLNTDKDKDK